MQTRKRKDKGVTIVEYAIMLAVIAVAVMMLTPNISSGVKQVFSNTTSILTR
jgi:Flp pilus assembly pilin Flp